MVNVERMETTLRVVNMFPERHNQYHYACGTSRCFAGFAIDLFYGEHVWSKDGSLFEKISGNNPYRLGELTYRRVGKDEFVTFGEFEGRYGGETYTAYDEHDYRWLSARETADAILDLGEDDSLALYNAENSAEDVNRIAKAIIADEEYECGPDCECDRHNDGCDCSYCRMDAADLAEVEDDDI